MKNSNKKLVIDESNLYYAIFLENDNTGYYIESKALEGGFKRQDKRHVTILGGSSQKLLKNILNKLPDEQTKNILKEINIFLESLNWEFTPKEIYLIQKHGHFDSVKLAESRESYINMIDMPDIDIFYKKLNSLLKTNIPTQIPHITLFTRGERENPNYYGISIPSIEEFENLIPRKSLHKRFFFSFFVILILSFLYALVV